ncbi:MAG TPA: hypothetical protein VLF59_02970 [Candidatus Saccharimonadales bacterium]|nr:hypothetical protein [Candidatus Saccharimonadales bacterium]
MATPERIRPQTAEQLLAVHREVSVYRGRLGAISVASMVDPVVRSRHFTLEMMGGVTDEGEPALTLYGDMRLRADSNRTRLKIPLAGDIDTAQVLQAGVTRPERLIDTARKGTLLLADYLALPEDERWEMRYIEGGPQKLYDEVRPADDTRGVFACAGLHMSEQQSMLDAFAIAHGIFIDQ